MDRRSFLWRLGLAGIPLALPAWACDRIGAQAMNASGSGGSRASADGSSASGPAGAGSPRVAGVRAGRQEIPPVEKSDDEWRALLSEAEYGVLFDEETERAFSSPLNEEKRAGTFICAACFLPLFDASTKFDSGTGWPSFWAAIEGHVEKKRDFLLIIPRTEYHCIRCGGHQGHIFNDGPPPTGKRYCNNGLALDFVPEGEELPPLRT